jgi:anti-sigma factor RsiW
VSPAAGFATRKDGYNLVRWTRNGLDYWAVSDVEASELELFHRTFAASA